MLSLSSAFQIVPSAPWNAGAIARPGKALLNALISKWQTAHATAGREMLSRLRGYLENAFRCVTRLRFAELRGMHKSPINWRARWRCKYEMIKESIFPEYNGRFENKIRGRSVFELIIFLRKYFSMLNFSSAIMFIVLCSLKMPDHNMSAKYLQKKKFFRSGLNIYR